MPDVYSSSKATHPLDTFYARRGLILPPCQMIEGPDVPEPYRTLLVHENDMTPTLEQFHGGSVHLRVLGRERQDNQYLREVVLQLEGTERPVEFGVIRIDLSLFAAAVRGQILREQWPLGHILRDYVVPHLCRPGAFLRMASDPLINSILDLTGARTLYGRRNTILDRSERPLAEIVEILPPAPSGLSAAPAKASNRKTPTEGVQVTGSDHSTRNGENRNGQPRKL